MKAMKSLLIIALIGFTFTASADNEPESKMQVKSTVVEGSSLDVRLFNLQQAATSITIESLDGQTVYFTHNIWKHNGFSQRIDLKDMKDGRYVIRFKQGDTTKDQVIRIANHKVQLSAVRSRG